ncbi:ribonuclease J [endosymbiont GvMRE of Glomus versiforme]|uniref:ribonuclease J n=1 Tax=endosymbiont GvMRE of Glomus versiforme TaxID=2039283 RepID=UPI000EC56A1A|nr:ribonuclease J [endosymbiont GvMRE of Glomus versiforme]RHZ35367.1 Ribonuclease J 1 [endosymbiont GvMRE of Glomus versiforme]
MDSNLKIFALGGLHEVGKNCYILEKNEDIIIVDCGIKFLNNSNSLADGVIPDFSYLLENKKKIKGLFITHGHEDHIGGIPYLLQLIPNIPVYGSEFSILRLEQNLRDKKTRKTIIFRDHTIVNTKEFQIGFFRVTHSIPGSFGLIIEVISDNIRIIITGDFKFDWTEIGEKTDLIKLAKASEKGVDLLLSDSTNAEIEGNTPSEKKVIRRLESIINEATGRVIITSFASNVYRLKEVIEIAKRTQKNIVLLGSTLLKMIKIIQKASLWKIDSSVFLKAEKISKVPNDKLIIFCTGSQGEEKAVLSKLAHRIYPGWKVAKGDSIILTSSPIMDNKSQIEAINDKLFALGAKIYENSKEDLLHSSGHACQEDLKLMLKLVNPTYFMPVHGDFRMIKKHGYLAQELGILKENIFVCQNGEMVEARDKKFFLSRIKMPIQSNYVSNGNLLSKEELKSSLELRNKVLEGGLFLIVIFCNKEKKILNKIPHIFTYGFINIKKNEYLINEWKKKINEFMIVCIQKKNDWKREIKDYVDKELLKNWTREKPYICPLIEEI